MFLKRLDISGFKSFSGKSVLDFEKGHKVTAIVGPNGSGKSNIADSIRWVLGETSYKTVRAKKSEDVIFSGSNGKAKASFARVAMVLDNADGKAPIDFSEVEIARSVFRDGSSEYLINGKKSRLLDVAELLARSGFGQSTYSVIGQGMVDSMLFYGPAERKVLFDEAAGVRQYEMKREQTLKKLEDTHSNITRAKDILLELNPRLGALKRQAEKAKEKDNVKEALLEKQKIYFASIWDKLSTEEKSKRADLERLSAEEAKVSEEIAILNETFSKILGKEKVSTEKTEKIQKEIAELEKQKDILRQGIYTLRTKIELSGSVPTQKELDTKIEKIKKDIAIFKTDDFEKTKEKLNVELADKVSAVSAINDQISEKRGELSESSQKILSLDVGTVSESISEILKNQENFLSEIEHANTYDEVCNILPMGKKVSEELKKLSKGTSKIGEDKAQEINKIQKEIEKLTDEKEKITEQISALKEKILAADYDLKREIETKSILEKELERLTNLKPAEESEKKGLEEEITSKEKQIEELDKNIKELRIKINDRSADFDTQGQKLSEIKDGLSAKQALIAEYGREITTVKIELARIETRKADIREEINYEMGSEAALADAQIVPELDEETTRHEIEKLKGKLYAIGEIDPEVETEFTEVNSRVEFLSKQTEDLEKAKTDLEKLISELDVKIKKQFENSFSLISQKFTHFFTLLFDGGEAKLELVKQKTDDEEDEGDDKFGIEITAIPPGKKVKSLSALSGGERTLTSLALLFAILSVNPAPFCVLDEVDAALDESNTKRFLKIVQELSTSTQFIFISHNRETMKEASVIYGITMDESHSSKILSVKLEEASEIVKKKTK